MTRVFIWKNGIPNDWEEIAFSAFCARRRNGDWVGHYFAKLHKHICDDADELILECSETEYREHSPDDRHSRYLKEYESKCTVVPFSGVSRTESSDDIQMEELLPDESMDTEAAAIQKDEQECFHTALALLSAEDREFILELYASDGESTRSYARQYGVHRTSVLRRKKKIEIFLKKSVSIFKKSGGKD